MVHAVVRHSAEASESGQKQEKIIGDRGIRFLEGGGANNIVMIR